MSIKSQYQVTLRSRFKKREAVEFFFFKQLRSLSDEALFRVFDIAAQFAI